MKKFKNYIDADLAKKKVSRYAYWSIKDENGITISSSDEESEDNRTFSELLDRLIADNVDAEVQIKYGTNEQSSRNNPPFFVRINEEIEWIEPEEETVTINGKPHKVDRNGNVNINLSSPERYQPEQPRIETANIDYVRQEMEMQLSGLKREYELKEEKLSANLQNQLAEQSIKFKELLLQDRLNKLSERERKLEEKEAELKQKEEEMRGNLKSYLKHVPTALGSVIDEFIKRGKDGLGEVKKEQEAKPKKPRREVQFSLAEDLPQDTAEEDVPYEEEEENSYEQTEESNQNQAKENEEV